ncbi:MAG: hypothetical protein QM741_00020 [Rudaea sp.]|uniref:hypothetical protein n=1 Tax=Rudaea sp. TaxID=2136325 RepID=UPI0039E59E5D
MNMRKLFGAIFFLGLGFVLLVALIILVFHLSATLGWIAFAIFGIAIVINGLLIHSEDKLPGSFYNPKRKEQEPKAH